MVYLTTPAIEACLYLLAAYGIFMSFRILRFPDLSVDNVFSFGAMAGAYVWYAYESLLFATIAATLFGCVAGIITSILYSYVHITKLLSGILMFTMLYSINLQFFNKPNVSLPSTSVDYQYLSVFVDAVVFLALYYLLKTSLGSALKAQGSNPRIHSEYNIPAPVVLGVGMGISSSLVALSGFVSAVYFGFSDSQLGFGILVHGVAGILIGEVFEQKFRIPTPFISIFLGIFVYSIILFAVISLLPDDYFSPSDTKLFSGIMVIILLLLNKNKKIELMSV